MVEPSEEEKEGEGEGDGKQCLPWLYGVFGVCCLIWDCRVPPGFWVSAPGAFFVVSGVVRP